MEPVQPATVAAIKADEFALKTIEAVVAFLYLTGRDWEIVRLGGQIPFKNEYFAISYFALCELIGRTEPPQIDGMVLISGVEVPITNVQKLDQAMASKSSKQD